MPEHYNIGGKKHPEGGTPLDLPENSFIFSDTKSMKIKDPVVLKMFNKGTKSMTPAAIAKQYDINKYHKILKDPYADKMSKDTAELMIKNYNDKLAELALVQESKKGFENGIPQIAIPLMEQYGVDPSALLPEMQEVEQPTMKYGGELSKYDEGGPTGFQYTGKYSNLKPWNELSDKEKAKWKNNQQEYSQFLTSVKLIQNDPELMQNIISKTREISEDEGSYTSKAKGKANYKQAIDSMDPNEVIDRLLAMEETNSRLKTFGLKANTTSQSSVKGSNTNEQIKKLIEEHKDELGDLQDNLDRAAKSQAAYLGYTKAIQGNEKYQYSPYRNVEGVDDEKSGYTQTTGIDSDWTNTTSGQFLGLSAKPAKEVPAEQKVTKTEEAPIDVNKPEDMEFDPGIPEDAPWWLQDQINLAGAAGDMFRIKNRMPWQATVNSTLADPTFYDPTRELAANAEQASIASQATSTFAGPQATGARLSAIQGQAAAQAANTLANYNRLNVDTANQFEQFNTGIQNQDALNRASLATSLFDKKTIADQQYDNAKNQAREMLRRHFVNGITNANKTATLNELYDNFKVDPTVGGRVLKNKNKVEITPKDYEDELLAKGKVFGQMKQMFPGVESDEIMKLVFGLPSKGKSSIDTEQEGFMKALTNMGWTPPSE